MKLAKEISIFLCDDIRQEMGNKISLMGLYSKEIIIPDIPFVFPRLCILLLAKELKSAIGDLRFVVTFSRRDPITVDVPAPNDQTILQDVQVAVTITSLKIDSEGKAKIEVFQKDDTKPFASYHFKVEKAK